MSLNPSHLKQLAINDNGFVFDPRTGHTFTLNATGVAVLEALKRGEPIEQIAAELTESFELEGSEDLARDVDDFVARLREYALLASSPEGSAP
ncbi:MAG: HPr-rel-A system PqqD family peptide chaperone [Deltaproteobacteria bacterium]|nr:HPr-rel-A system PqqD family peptide chaperone [Deltaproteobacteria bacterium]